MIQYATDGFYFPMRVIERVVYLSLGGAPGGVPERAEAHPEQPDLVVHSEARPDLEADELVPVMSGDQGQPSPSLTVQLIRPQFGTTRTPHHCHDDPDEP